MRSILTLTVLAVAATVAAGTSAMAQGHDVVQIVALDECEPDSFNAALGPDFCRNVALAKLGFATTKDELFAKAKAGTPDPGWDFEPDSIVKKRGTVFSVVNQGGEPHTFTEVAKFGGGFVGDLNHGEETAPECVGGFSNLDVPHLLIE